MSNAGRQTLQILIIDDELIICELIQRLIDWDSLPVSLIGFAHDSEQALAMIEERRPDIVISDIAIPGENGLRVIEKAEKLVPDASFVIISGHRDFDYAKEAIKFGVEDYLLKPIKEKEINALLGRIVERKLAERKNREETLLKDSIVVESRETCRGAFLRIATDEDADISRCTIESVNGKYFYNFVPGCFRIIVFKLDGRCDESCDRQTDERICRRICKTIAEKSGTVFVESHAALKRHEIHLIVNYPPDSKTFQQRYGKELLALIQDCAAKYGDYFSITAALGSPQDEIRDIKRSFEHARNLIAHRMDFSNLNLIDDSEPIGEYSTPLVSELEDLVQRELNQIAARGERGSWRAFLSHLASGGGSVYEVVATMVVVADIMARRTDEQGLLGGEFDEYRCRMEDCVDINTALTLTGKLGDAYIDAWLKALEQRDNKPVRVVKDYIEANFSEDITLEKLAKLSFLNPNYLCTVFKKEVGMSVVDYITSARMERAKELLISTPMYIADIARSVGYADMRYFSKQFQRFVGIKPSEYRKYHS